MTIGALNLFSNGDSPMAEADVVVASGFADLATISVIQFGTALEAQRVNEQLSHAITSRIVIEQAKGGSLSAHRSICLRPSPGCGICPPAQHSPG